MLCSPQYFTQKLNETVKLVAPTISCQPSSPLPPESNNNELMPPYAQFSVIATDQVQFLISVNDLIYIWKEQDFSEHKTRYS